MSSEKRVTDETKKKNMLLAMVLFVFFSTWLLRSPKMSMSVLWQKIFRDSMGKLIKVQSTDDVRVEKMLTKTSLHYFKICTAVCLIYKKY